MVHRFILSGISTLIRKCFLVDCSKVFIKIETFQVQSFLIFEYRGSNHRDLGESNGDYESSSFPSLFHSLHCDEVSNTGSQTVICGVPR
ncbi:unnamed protein product, partial [Vitis vinifera]|uniref:Uncharacterized protein n=1 Tax=Vitis vinifera TaxID=29760 RepID=D7U6T9_VITVI